MLWFESLDETVKAYLPDLAWECDAAMVENGFVRHQPDDLARELMRLQQERSVRIAGDRVNICGDAYQVEKK